MESGEILTNEMLEKMKPQEIFATGELVDGPEGLNMVNSGQNLRWVAVRGGGIPDWTIYCGWATKTIEEIAKEGDKVIWKKHIQKCVPCTDEAFGMYRY